MFSLRALFCTSAFLLCSLPAHAVLIELAPQGPTNFDLNQAPAQITYNVNISGLTAADEVLSAYDFGIAYDPNVLSLNAFNGFSLNLGDGSIFEAFNADHLDPVNSTWDYTANHSTLGPYTGPMLGTPNITGSGTINEGSLRFAQASLLSESELRSLQDPTNNDGFTLFSLVFDVDTSAVQSTPIQIIDDRYYQDFMSVSSAELDIKLSDGFTPVYPDLAGSTVNVVPIPGTLWLMLSAGLGYLGINRRSMLA